MDLDVGSAICLFIFALETLFGVGSSLFIMITTLGDLFKGKTLQALDKILCALSFSNTCFSAMLPHYILTDVFCFPLDFYPKMIILCLDLYGRTSCPWMLSCLCFFYFIKIIQFQSRIFSLVKRKIDLIIQSMILIIQAFSLCGSFFCILMENLYGSRIIRSDFGSSNITRKSNQTTLTDFFYLNAFVPFGVGTLITAFTTLSLQLHVRKMSRNVGSSDGTNTKGVQEVVKTLACLLIYDLFYFLLMFLESFSDMLSYHLWDLVDLIVVFAFTPVLNILLIQSNPKYNYILKRK